MNHLVIDLTHGGVKIAISLAKEGKNVLAYDLYNTLNDIDAKMLNIYNVDLIQLNELADFRGDINVIYPIHMPLDFKDIIKHNPRLNYTFQTHHEIIHDILVDWGKDLTKVEITGVKGKTSTVFMLKEILIDENPLILSSLGAILYENKKKIMLKQNISIAPANIKETIDLAYKIANPTCRIDNGIVKGENARKYNSALFESSLGVSGIGDVGVLTNIVENYPISKGKRSASEAKKQVFNCNTVVCQKEAYDTYYSNVKHEKMNTFSLVDETSNLYLNNVSYSLNETKMNIIFRNIKTINDNIVSGEINLTAFAPGKHNVSNVLGVILTALSLEIPKDKIINGIENYKGIPGRTNKRQIENITVIEEINPGINTKAIEESINMIDNPDDYIIAIGGDYGITCEEINENKVSEFLDKMNCNIILTGEVGSSIQKKMSKKCQIIEDYNEVYNIALKNDKNLLFIYRSDYRKLKQR